jgi:hypothetical protein
MTFLGAAHTYTRFEVHTIEGTDNSEVGAFCHCLSKYRSNAFLRNVHKFLQDTVSRSRGLIVTVDVVFAIFVIILVYPRFLFQTEERYDSPLRLPLWP